MLRSGERSGRNPRNDATGSVDHARSRQPASGCAVARTRTPGDKCERNGQASCSQRCAGSSYIASRRSVPTSAQR